MKWQGEIMEKFVDKRLWIWCIAHETWRMDARKCSLSLSVPSITSQMWRTANEHEHISIYFSCLIAVSKLSVPQRIFFLKYVMYSELKENVMCELCDCSRLVIPNTPHYPISPPGCKCLQ